MEVIKKGSVESLLVPLRDRLDNVNNLSLLSSFTFDTKKKSDGSAVESNKNVWIDADYPMTAVCEIDSSLSGYAGGEQYKLYLKYISGTEAPILGPIFFRVEDD